MKFGYQSKFDRMEKSVGDFHPNTHRRDKQLYSPHRPPENEFQALMESMPLTDVPMTEREREADWMLFEDKIEQAGLTEREALVMHCVVFGGMSLTQAAVIVAQAEGLSKAPPKMTIARVRDRAFNKLRIVFGKDDE